MNRRFLARATVLGVVTLLPLYGCSGKSSVHYAPPSGSMIDNSIVIDTNLETTWNHLQHELSEELFTLEVKESSHIINASFSTTKPSDYIDCGRSIRTFVSASGQSETYRYDTADSSMIKLTDANRASYSMSRQTSLDGTATVRVDPIGPNETKISVNVRYVWKLDAIIQKIDNSGNPLALPQTQTIINNLDTNRPSSTLGADSVLCRSNGALERLILQKAQVNG